MLSGFTITCANKNQRGIITRVGGAGWSMQARDAIIKVLSEQVRFNIQIEGKFIEIGIRGNGSDAYFVIEPEGFPLHDLPDLPSC
jgi:hypothetical protein